MAQNPFIARTGIVSGNLSVNTTALTFGSELTVTTTNITVGNAGTNSAITKTNIVSSNSTANVVITPTVVSVANNSVSANLELLRLIVGGSIVNSTGLYGGVVNATSVNSGSYTVGTNFTANATLVNAAALNVINQTNTATIFVTTAANVGSNVVANATGVWVNGTVNSVTLQTGAAFTANSTLVNAAALNVVNQINSVTIYTTTSVNVGSGPLVNTTAFSLGSFLANSTVVSIGTNASLNSTAFFVGNGSVNCVINSTTIFFNGVNFNPGGAKGGGTDLIFYENGLTVNTNYTITTNKNAMTAGPITINGGATVTVPAGQRWTVV